MKKLVSLVLCAAMLIGLVACGNQETPAAGSKESSQASQQGSSKESTPAEGTTEGTTGAGAINFDEDPYELHICYAVGGEAQPDLAMIQEKLNEITLREINATVTLEAVSLFSLANVYALKASSQEKMDLMIMFPGSSYLTNFANSNMIMPIEEYVDEWGGNIREVLGDMLKAGEFKGHLYGIPQNKDVRTNAYGFTLSKSLCEKHNIDPSSIKTLEEMENVFEMIKEKEPEVTVLMPETTGSSIAMCLMDYYDTCGAGGGALQVQEDGSLKIVNQLEDEAYMEACKKAREWYEKGYISKDVLTAQDSGSQALMAGKCFANAVSSINANMGDKNSSAVILNPEKPLVGTNADQLILWGVPSSCKRPEKAIQFLNMCFGSEEVSNLMMYGVEGVHYTVLEDGTIDTSQNANWQNYWPMFGDYNKEYITNDRLANMPGADTVEEYQKKMADWEVEVSPAYGFNFDTESVKTEIAACDAVNNEYQLVITNGTVDPETELPKYIQKLYDSGLQKIMDEKQRQLDEWVASQK